MQRQLPKIMHAPAKDIKIKNYATVQSEFSLPLELHNIWKHIDVVDYNDGTTTTTTTIMTTTTTTSVTTSIIILSLLLIVELEQYN
jgi:hypothetical protein